MSRIAESPLTSEIPAQPVAAAAPAVGPRDAALLLQLLSGMQSKERLQPAVEYLVQRLRQLLGCDSVAVGLAQGRRRACRLTAVSGVSLPDRKSEPVRLFEAAMDEVLSSDDLHFWSVEGAGEASARPQEQVALCLHCEAVCSTALKSPDGERLGALILCGPAARLSDPKVVSFVRGVQALLGTSLKLLASAEPSMWTGVVRRLRRAGLRSVLLAMLLGAALLLCPVPYRIGCDAELQPVTRRYVVAPFAGLLQRCLAEPGHVVARGDVLASLDAEEIRLQRTSLQARLEQAVKKHDVALAKGDGVTAQVAKLDMRSSELELQILDRRLSSLEIRSPIDGVVVSGDLKRVEGAPLTVGQSLFEIAPLEEMIVELAVEEDAVSQIQLGAHVRLKLNAFPGVAWTGVIDNVHPRTELVKDRTVFIAELHLKDTEGRLRPGMTGWARIHAGKRPLGWILLHEPLQKLALRWGW